MFENSFRLNYSVERVKYVADQNICELFSKYIILFIAKSKLSWYCATIFSFCREYWIAIASF
jgi:hypothetical protein